MDDIIANDVSRRQEEVGFAFYTGKRQMRRTDQELKILLTRSPSFDSCCTPPLLSRHFLNT